VKHEYFKYLLGTDVEAIFYIDADVLITNFNIGVEDFLDNEHDLYLTRDVNEINSGVLILKNTDKGEWINEFILGMRGYFENEQNIINQYMKYEKFNRHVKVLPHPSINSYNYSIFPVS